jgi:Asp-tRNA(Asn)/Glu-tRNA(Gln) amidotransferase A subunit family amidase
MLGAFHGVPISVKDMINQKGKTSSVGSTWMASHYVASEDAPTVQWLLAEGAVPMVRGNLP